ncbi:MAG: type VI secretion system tube protein TssD [Candidatus Binatia bacterium]
MISAYLRVIMDPKLSVRDRDSGKDGNIELLAVEHALISPRDSASGMATGKRQHLPITITKVPDQTSPFFYESLARNREIPQVDLLFFGSNDRGGFLAGREATIYTISITKAFVSRIDFTGREDREAKDDIRFPLSERIAFVYDSIRWEWVPSKSVAEDNFNSKS